MKVRSKIQKSRRRWPTWGESECRILNIEAAKREAIRRASLPHAARMPCKGGANYHVFTLCADACSICGAIR